MGWPITFGTQNSPEPMSNLDLMFNQAAAGMSIPCSVVGTNALSISPLTNFPALAAYTDLFGCRFVAVATSTGVVTAQYNGLGFLNVYHSDGVTQVSTGDLVIGQQYIVTFHQALNGGLGGWYLESPSAPVLGSNPWFAPGGRLTFVSATPVMFSSQASPQTLYYAPYIHPFVPIYNGSNLQMYQFTSSLSDQVGLTLAMGGSTNWPGVVNYDCFAFLLAGVPTLGTFPWTNLTTRAVSLGVFGGLLTNGGSLANIRYGAAGGSAVLVPVNQATFLGTMMVGGVNGQSVYIFPAANTGGNFGLSNYYNPVLVTGFVSDTGAQYTYTSATVRQARAASTMQVSFLQTSSERAIWARLAAGNQCVGSNGAGTLVGMAVDSTTTFAIQTRNVAQGANSVVQTCNVSIAFSATGYHTLSANEAGDGVNANTFDVLTNNQLSIQLWL